MEGEKVAHTAEHAFIGALKKILGKTLQVRKVEHKKDGSNTAFIAISQLDVGTVVRAESLVNALMFLIFASFAMSITVTMLSHGAFLSARVASFTSGSLGA